MLGGSSFWELSTGISLGLADNNEFLSSYDSFSWISGLVSFVSVSSDLNYLED